MNKKAKILIADDSEFMRRVLREILENGGLTNLIECSNGKECLDVFKADNPDLVLLDIIMPEMDGMEVLKQIGGKVNVIIISAVGQEKVMEEAKRYGALGYIVKPFDKDQVLDMLGQVLK